MATQLSAAEVEEVQDGFSLYDKIGDGKIESNKIGEVLRAVGQNPTNVEVDKIIKQLDPKGNRRVSLDDFLPVYQSTRSKARHFGHEDFVDSLKVFDSDGSGTISAGELRHVLTSIGEKLTDDEVDTLFQSIDFGQGQVNYEDFIKTILTS